MVAVGRLVHSELPPFDVIRRACDVQNPHRSVSANIAREQSIALLEQKRLAERGIDSTAQFGDADTADIFTEISREIDKQLWFIEAHLQSDK